jgi:methylenetetrahydrofolate dehydrogenase (NADP+)/methenyltetrahydrofolate cyclohydrolase
MSGVLLEGKLLAEKIRDRIQDEVSGLKAKFGRSPKLAAIQIGEHSASQVYLKNQAKLALALGIEYDLEVLPASVSQADVERLIARLNSDPSVTAIILQLPVPGKIDAKKLSGLIKSEKDAEGMHPENLGRLLSGKTGVGPCTAMAVMELLEFSGISLYGKEVCLVGHSAIVGKPLALMLLNKFATVTVCHIATSERGFLAHHVARAEIVIVAVGRPGVIKGDWIKEDAVVIDVGINRVGDKIVGDVEFDIALKRASLITPVPGGVGALTTTILMRNVVELFKQNN